MPVIQFKLWDRVKLTEDVSIEGHSRILKKGTAGMITDINHFKKEITVNFGNYSQKDEFIVDPTYLDYEFYSSTHTYYKEKTIRYKE